PSAYHWYTERYGVKWPCGYDLNISSQGENFIQVDFDTPWCQPESDVVAELSRRFGCTLEHWYAEQGCNFCGWQLYERGELVDVLWGELEWSSPTDDDELPEVILAKGRPRLPQNPLPDVLGWKYSGNRHHPTEKPVTSLQPLIESFTHPNAIVLDPFAGSGSTCVAAFQSGRRYIGIELLEQYHRAGQQRLAAVQRAMQQGAANDDWFMPEAA
ncbi:hypothetical protein MP845_24560, partial [Escherichia coli]|uniref:DNA methyltransferase n=1 Tax=Escherichia coli TaxID=562 RepID=UPI0022453ED4